MGKMQEIGVEMKELEELTGFNSLILKGEFTAYSVSNGTCVPIIDEQTGLIKENELDSASDYNAGVFDRLYQLYIQKLRDK